MTRRTIPALALIASAVAFLASQLSWPAGSDGDGAAPVNAAVGHPALWTLAVVLETISWLLLIPGVIAVLGWLRSRGRALALVGASLTVIGAVSLSSGGVVNIATLTLGQHLPVKDAVSLSAAIGTQPYLVALIVGIYLGTIGIPLVGFAAWRGGLVRWWVPTLMVVGALLETVASGLDAPMSALVYLPLFVATVVLGVALLRAPVVGASIADEVRPAPVTADA